MTTLLLVVGLVLTVWLFASGLHIDNYQDGAQATIQFQTAVGVTTLSIRSSTGDLESIVHDVTGTRHRGNTARIGGKIDYSTTLTAAFDLDQPPWALPPLLVPNSNGILFLGLAAGGSGSAGVSCGVIISKLHFEQAVDKEIIYSFDAKMNILAGPLFLGARAF